MTLDTKTLREWFDYFNHLCFQDGLPVPQLKLSKSRTRLGTMTCRRIRRHIIMTKRTYTLRISTYYESTERELQDVLLHEMIHYFISFNNLHDTSPHGKLFIKMMNEINRTHRRNITVSSHSANKKVAATISKQLPRLVLAMEMNGKECYLTVVNQRYANDIKSKLKIVKDLTSHSWFVSADPFFHDFPTVRSLRARKVSRETLEQKVAEGQKIDF